jgi:glycosyltransferase involved in cell wall biosynthesis
MDRGAWVAALRRLAADPELRRRMGRRARERARDYTWDKVAGRRLSQLEEALALREAGRRA